MNRLNNLEHRINLLNERIKLQSEGPEFRTAKKILEKLELEYLTLKAGSSELTIDATSTVKDFVSEEELIKNLGAIYWIFGSVYEETVSFKKYRIEFIKILPDDKEESGCLLKVKVNIFENDRPLMVENASLEFWKGWGDSVTMDNVSIACHDFDRHLKYNNFHWFSKISFSLIKTWNRYFNDVPLIDVKQSGFIDSDVSKKSLVNKEVLL